MRATPRSLFRLFMSASSSAPTSTIPAKVLEGVFAINKPTGTSSAQVLRDLQRTFEPSSFFAPYLANERANRAEQMHAGARRGQRYGPKKGAVKVKLGHGGTLDPLATGVLIVGVGKGTKSLQGFLECTKSYECVVLFGAATDTYDTVGKIVAKAEYAQITEAKACEALEKFRGTIMQTPPMYSALKVQGKKLYEYAREGVEVPIEIKPREVTVSKLELLEWMEGGSHEYKWPAEEAPAEEKDVAEKLGVVPATEGGTKSNLSAVKRKREDTDESSEKKSKDNPSLLTHSPAPTSTTMNGTITESTPSSQQIPSVKTDTNPTTADAPSMSGALPASSTTDSHPYTDPQPAPGVGPEPKPQHGPQPQPPPNPSHTNERPPAARLRMTVTSGFYVRSLCHDLGHALGSAACMAALVRTRQEKFVLHEAEAAEAGAETADVGSKESNVATVHGSADGVPRTTAVASVDAEQLEGKPTHGKAAKENEKPFTTALEYTDLARGEEVWSPHVGRMLMEWEARNRPQQGGGRGGGVSGGRGRQSAREQDEEDENPVGAEADAELQRGDERRKRRNSSSSGSDQDRYSHRRDQGHGFGSRPR